MGSGDAKMATVRKERYAQGNKTKQQWKQKPNQPTSQQKNVIYNLTMIKLKPSFLIG